MYMSRGCTLIYEMDIHTKETLRTVCCGMPGDVIIDIHALKAIHSILVLTESSMNASARSGYVVNVSDLTPVRINLPLAFWPLPYDDCEYDQGRIAILSAAGQHGDPNRSMDISLWNLATGELESVTMYSDRGERSRSCGIACGAGRVFEINDGCLAVFDDVEKGGYGSMASAETHPHLEHHVPSADLQSGLARVGKHIAYCRHDDRHGGRHIVVLLDPDTFETVDVIAVPEAVYAISATSCGRLVAMRMSDCTYIWDGSTRAFIRKIYITGVVEFDDDWQGITVMGYGFSGHVSNVTRVTMAPLVIEANGVRLYADGYVVDASADNISHPPFGGPHRYRQEQNGSPAPICATDTEVDVWKEAIDAVVANRSLPPGSRAIIGDNVILSRRFALLQIILFHARGADQSTGRWIPREIIKDIAKYTF